MMTAAKFRVRWHHERFGSVRTMVYLALGFFAVLAACLGFNASAGEMPRYEHIFVIVAENKSFDQIIGNPDAPKLNGLAKEYGLATRFYGEVHPSEGNYVAM